MIKCTNRRSISSVIGGAVFLVLFISGFTVFMLAIQVSEDRFSNQLSASFEETLRGKESFTIAPSVDTSNEFYIQVDNTGSQPINILEVFLVNRNTGAVLEYEINFQDAHIAPNESKAIFANYVEGTDRTVANGTYDVKVVSELGTMITQKMVAPLDPLFADLFTIPKNLGSGHNVTVNLFVYNRGNATVFDVQPVNATSVMTDPSTAIQNTIGPIPSDPVSLEPQESAFFSWEMQVIGAIGTQINYTNIVNGTDPASGDVLHSNFDSALVEFVPQAIKLLQAPELVFIIPNPSGEVDADVDPLYGLNVINPTDVAITVSRVIFTASANSQNVQIFTDTCNTTNVSPGTGTWECPADNVLMWENLSSPITIPGRDVQAFLVQTDDAVIASSDDPATVISGTVFSSFGPFTELGTVTGVIDSAGNDGAMVSMLVSSTTDSIISGGVLDTTDIIGNLTDICSGTTFNLNFFVASLGDEAGSDIELGTFIVNVPAGFAVGTPVDNNSEFTGTGNTVALSVQEFSDGSNQVKGVFENLAEEDFSVTIPLTAPNVTANALYIVFGLVEGLTVSASEHPVGPIAEFPVQVLDIDDAGC